jgi:hypothetical protein
VTWPGFGALAHVVRIHQCVPPRHHEEDLASHFAGDLQLTADFLKNRRCFAEGKV